jgi:branched-chain amino acid transport system substrate-binding protein
MILRLQCVAWLALAFFTASCSTGSGLSSARNQPERAIQPRPEPPPKSNVPKASPERLFEAARKFFDSKDYNRAYDFYMAAASGWTGKPRESEALVWANRSLFRGGRFHESAELSSRLLKTQTWNEQLASELTGYLFKSQESIGDIMAALTTAVEAQKNSLLSKEAESYRLKSNELVESRLTASELESVATNDFFGVLKAVASYRLGEMALDERNQDQARKYFSRAVSVGPQTEAGVRAQEMLEQLEAVRRVEPKTIGVILPMTGRHSSISQKTLRGVQMGLGLYNNIPTSFKLAVIDDEGNPDNARRGVERLVKEDNVIAVIGSVQSRTAPAVASKASELGVPSIALSQKAGITEASNLVFRNSLTSEMQVRYLVKTAMDEMGMKRFAILYPNDFYGTEFANIFWDEVLARGGTIVGAQTYSNKETDFRYPVQRLVGTYYVESRAEEYNQRLKEWAATQPKKTARLTPPEDLLPPIVDFDAIFIPDSVKTMGQISAMLSFNGVKGIRLLGTNLWNVPGVNKRAGHFSNNILFVDGFASAEPRFLSSGFVKDYKALFNEDPGIFEVQGYDAALMLRQLISQGSTSRDSLSRALLQVNDFPGSVGPLSITPDREIMRPLVVLTLDSSGAIVPYQKPKTP